VVVIVFKNFLKEYKTYKPRVSLSPPDYVMLTCSAFFKSNSAREEIKFDLKIHGPPVVIELIRFLMTNGDTRGTVAVAKTPLPERIIIVVKTWVLFVDVNKNYARPLCPLEEDHDMDKQRYIYSLILEGKNLVMIYNYGGISYTKILRVLANIYEPFVENEDIYAYNRDERWSDPIPMGGIIDENFMVMSYEDFLYACLSKKWRRLSLVGGSNERTFRDVDFEIKISVGNIGFRTTNVV
tara:strand:- start:1566 stop:2282 length:717 start_codon:yes stop_codon:yes gene_type:complete